MPNFRDHWVTDADGNEFIFRVEVQRRLSEAGLPVEVEYIEQLGEAAPAPQQRSSNDAPRESKPAPAKEEITGPDSIQIDPMTGKYIGRVKWYNERKGYGFLLRGAGEEIFFHRSNAIGDADSLQEGQWILYDVEETNKGPEATDIEGYDAPQSD